MATPSDATAVTATLTGTTADAVTILQPWPTLRVTNHDNGNTLWVRFQGGADSLVAAVANGAGCIPIRPGQSRLLQAVGRPGLATVVLSVVGSGGSYTVEGTNFTIASSSALSDEIQTVAASLAADHTKAAAVKPAAALAETLSVKYCPGGNTNALLTGRLTLSMIWLEAGTPVTNITFVSGTTAAATSTHVWYSLYSAALGLLAVTSDDTAASPWAASTVKSLAVTGGPYVVPTTGWYNLGCNVTAGTVPTLWGHASTAPYGAVTPQKCGLSSTGLTDPASAPATAAAITALNVLPYAYVS